MSGRAELGEDLLDGVEIGRICRKEQEARAGRLIPVSSG
jgi:hypothetical protein